MQRPDPTPAQRKLLGVVVGGAAVIALIGFIGSYTAVSKLARAEGLGDFSAVFPLGVDAGIVVLLALDLVLAWQRIPFPLLRYGAWALTGATIWFNAAAAWPDPLGVGMHAVIPVLFVVIVEAARHAVGRIADITADRHMEPVRLARWLLAPRSTFVLWRRMKLWELRSYDEVIKLEQDRIIYRAQLQARFGRRWRSKAPVEMLLPLRLSRIGRPLAPVEEQPAGEPTAAAVEPVGLMREPEPRPALSPGEPVSREPAGPDPTPEFDDTVRTALAVAAPEPPTVSREPAPTPAACDQQGSREPGVSPREPSPAAPGEPSSEPAGLTDPDTDVTEQQITTLAAHLRSGERLTKTLAAQLLGVSEATAGRRLKAARTRVSDGTGFYT